MAKDICVAHVIFLKIALLNKIYRIGWEGDNCKDSLTLALLA